MRAKIAFGQETASKGAKGGIAHVQQTRSLVPIDL